MHRCTCGAACPVSNFCGLCDKCIKAWADLEKSFGMTDSPVIREQQGKDDVKVLIHSFVEAFFKPRRYPPEFLRALAAIEPIGDDYPRLEPYNRNAT